MRSRDIAILLTAWIGLGLLQVSNRHAPGTVAIILLAVAAGVAYLVGQSRAGGPAETADSPRRQVVPISMMALSVIVALHVVYALARLNHPSIDDIGLTTLDAGRMLVHGIDPYTSPIDTEAMDYLRAQNYPGDVSRFGGYKYTPVMALAYLPLGLAWGARGLIATNFLLMLGTLFLVYRLGREMLVPRSGFVAAIFLALVPLMAFQSYAKGVTDLVPVILILAALLLQDRRGLVAGLALGLAISAKLMPGLALIPFLLPARDRLGFLLGLALGLLPALAVALVSPTGFLDNILLFNLIRPRDATSWLYDQPHWVAQIVDIAFVILWAALALVLLRRPASLTLRCGAVIVTIIGLLLVGPASHENYMMWWIPFFAVLIGRAAVTNRISAPAGLPHGASTNILAG